MPPRSRIRRRSTGRLYAAQEGQGLFHWGVTWKRHKRYPTLDAVRRELKLEAGSRSVPFVFRDYLTRDFRVPPDSPALKMGCYPKGAVPCVQLGAVGATCQFVGSDP